MLKDKLKTIREEKGMTKYRLSQITGLNESTIMRYENGTIKKISLDNLIKICNALEIDVKEVI